MTREDGVGLAAAARLLALAFGPPQGESLAEIDALAAGLEERSPEDVPEVGELRSLLRRPGLAGELAPAYAALVDGEAACPPYEGSYEADPFRHSREMADVAGFYRAFGTEPAGERPDHAGCELEFLAFLVATRLDAEQAGDAGRTAVCLDAENAFLSAHLGRWFPTFCRRVAEASSDPFYSCAARLGERVVVAELSRRGLRVEPLRGRTGSSVEADTIECGATAGFAAPG
jgi:TorA maturation chaperone TorD